MSVGGAVFAALFLLLFYAVAILILVLGIREIRLARGARAWPMTGAVLEQSEVRSGWASNTRVYSVSLQYTYAVAGVSYSGSTLAIGAGGASDRKPADEAHRRVVALQPFMIRYNPAAPAMSAVFLSDSLQTYGTFFGGMFALAVTTVVTLAILGISGGLQAIGRWLA